MQVEVHVPRRRCRGRFPKVYPEESLPMPRPARAFTAESFELEGRLLLAARFPTTSAVPPPPPPPPVQFESAMSFLPASGTSFVPLTGTSEPFQVVSQQAGEATVVLSRTDTAGSLQVLVTESSSSPNVVGVSASAEGK